MTPRLSITFLMWFFAVGRALSFVTTATIGPTIAGVKATEYKAPSALCLNNVATPFEEQEKEKQKKREEDIINDDDDWTEVEGGFIPRIGRRLDRQLITEVTNLQDYKREVVDCEEKIVVVKFYAPWCRSCKSMEPLFKRMANSLSSDTSIKFVQVSVTADNAMLHQGLGVPSVPFGHIYHKDVGLVEELTLKKKEFRNFEKILDTYVEGSCDIETST
mmetsp:Transcript_13171/g.19374  ORF Transcript_13171/g.19374 Transcript_13171/m.19374 type:complete len:218 (+) Transcript_13171:203-856(+)